LSIFIVERVPYHLSSAWDFDTAPKFAKDVFISEYVTSLFPV